jgi:hypothetical protein
MEFNENTKEISHTKLQLSPNIFKTLSLIFIGMTGFLSGFEPFGGILLLLIDAV